MKRDVYIVSSEPATRQAYVETLNTIGAKESWGEIGTGRQVYSGNSSLWLYLISPAEAGYEQAELKYLTNLLGAEPRNVLQLEYNEGSRCASWVRAILEQVSKKWPIVFDDCYDRIYGPTEIDQILATRI